VIKTTYETHCSPHNLFYHQPIVGQEIQHLFREGRSKCPCRAGVITIGEKRNPDERTIIPVARDHAENAQDIQLDSVGNKLFACDLIPVNGGNA